MFIFQILFVICITISSKKKSPYSKPLLDFHILALVCMVFFQGTILLDEKSYAEVFHSLYYASIDWFLFVFLRYVMSLSGKVIKSKVEACFRWSYIFVASIDTLIMILNVHFHFAFDIQPLFIDNIFYCWLTEFHLYYYIHLVVCYLIIAIIVLEIIYRIYAISNMYRFKYIFIFVSFIFILIINIVFMMFMPVLKIDYSVLVFSALSLSIFFFSLFKIPKRLESELLSIISQNISNPVICFNNDGECIYKNSKAENFLRTPGALEWCKKMQSKDLDISIMKEHIKVLNDDGNLEDRIFNIEYKWIKSKNDEVIGSFIILDDVTVEVENTLREEMRARHDELTGLYNRSYFFEKVEEIIRKDPDEPRYLVCTNINQFKVINNLFGMHFGDLILKKQAEMLNRASHYKDVVIGRTSGDKFAMLIRKCDFNPALAIKNSDLMLDYANEKNYKLKVFIGVYEIVNPYEHVNTMYDKAVLAIKSNKYDFSKNIFFYDSSLMTRLLNEKNIINDFQQALEANQITMFLQPQIDAKTGRCVGAEALARWSHVERGLLSPDKFVSILEEAGLVFKLDCYMWKKAVQKLSEWKRKGIDYYISVNISPKDFYYADIYKELTELVEFYKVSPSKINLEITETILIDKNTVYKNTLSQLQNYGFNIEMDDFGSGFSSFRTLREIKMNVLKIDKEFLHETDESTRSNMILISIVKMAKKMGLTVVVEGVETENHVALLQNAGADILQGFYYSRPITVGDFESKYLEVKE